MTLTIHTVLEQSGPATAIELTDAQVESLGGGKRAAVRVRIGDREAQLRLGVMGGRNLIGMSKAAREQLGVDYGDEVDAIIELDVVERVVEMPDDLAAALDVDPSLRAAFEGLPYSHRKERARSVADAKKAETREARIAKIVQEMQDRIS